MLVATRWSHHGGRRQSRAGGRWFVDETYVKANRQWTYLYRAIDQHGQVIDVWGFGQARPDRRSPLLHPPTRDRRRACRGDTDRAPVYPSQSTLSEAPGPS